MIVSHRPAEIPGVTVYSHPLSLVGFLRHMWGVRRLIRRLRPDVIHAHQFGAHGLYAWFAGCAPVVITAWGSDILVRAKQSRLLRALTRFQIKRAVLLTADSAEVTRELIKLGARPERILTFSFGVPRRVFERLSQAEKERCPLVICSPRLHEPIYNLPVILEAFTRIKDEWKDTELWMLGDGSLTAQLKEYVKDCGMAERVHFLGRVSPELFSEKLAESHLMITIPSSDGTPISLLEAMAAGCLPIAADLPVYREWIEDRVNGLLTAINPVALAETMRRGISDSDLREKAARLNRKTIFEKAITEEQFRIMLQKYEEVAKRT